MKKIVYFIITGISTFSSCSPIKDPPGTIPCDDTEKDINVTMDWSQSGGYNSVFYNLTGQIPPYYKGYSPLTASASSIANTSFVPYYYCKVTVESACTRNGGSQYSKSYIWSPGGVSLPIKVMKNEDSKITIEYYVGCEPYGPNSTVPPTGYAHPYFVGVLPLSKTATSAAVQMTRQTNQGC